MFKYKMRCRMQFLLFLLLVETSFILFIWTLYKGSSVAIADLETTKDGEEKCSKIQCLVNGDYNVSCLKSNDVYLPFSFVRKYFDVYGKLTVHSDVERFEFEQSYGAISTPNRKYDPTGAFTHFQNFKVEERERVFAVSPVDGVPLSRQWSTHPYRYPTQIAQYGLSHYSKLLTEPKARVRPLESGKRAGNWTVPARSHVRRTKEYGSASVAMCYSAGRENPIGMMVDDTLPILGCDLKVKPNTEFELRVRVRYRGELYDVRYTCADQPLVYTGNSVVYGLACSHDGEKRTSRKLSRDLALDVHKGYASTMENRKTKVHRSGFVVVAIYLYGEGCIDNLTLFSADHRTQFKFAVDWLVRNQDDKGGWATPVSRRITDKLKLEPGWYSAMSQGHALSLLVRAHHTFGGDERYLAAAERALLPFDVRSEAGGVLAHFLGTFAWYEEYPTTPSTFVLNGFMYALIGLFDLAHVAPEPLADRARTLYEHGVQSLKTMLPLYDTGSGTTYDLRHVALHSAPRLARWDYHTTHINQLLLLATVDKDPIFKTTAKRWIGYMKGKRASHN